MLKAGGLLLLIEHVAAWDDPGLLWTQRALDPLQILLADGCHLTRDTQAAVAAAGFDVDGDGDAGLGLQRMYVGSGLISPHVVGVARVSKPSSPQAGAGLLL